MLGYGNFTILRILHLWDNWY